jgi:creatinine amidohydrolase
VTALADLTWPEAEARRGAGGCLVVPVGSTEQHGPHLPVSTDTDIAVALAERLAWRLVDAVVAPAAAYGASGEHQAFAGTISVGHEALELLLVELARSATETFERAAARLRAEGRDVVAWQAQWRGDAHAGRVETSIMLALWPERVALDRAEAGNTTSIAELMPALRAQGVRPVSANGVLGDPAAATAEEGLLLLDTATAALVAAVGRR